MKATMQKTMQAAAINRFGGLDELSVRELPLPEIGPDEILIHVESAGVGVWDPFEREGGFVHLLGIEPKFPYVLGTDGAGTVADVDHRVTRFREGDRVYGMSVTNPKGGFYAEYTTIKADHASHIPDQLSTEEAGGLAADALTALQGLEDHLKLEKDESVMIFGASGGVGHLAVQLAKLMGARVLAVASGDDGVALARKLGADAVVNGRKQDVAEAARRFARDGLDAALLTAGGEAAEKALETLREGGRVAFPHGVRPEPQARPTLTIRSYNGRPNPEAIDKLNHLIEAGPFEVHIARVFSLDQIAEAHRTLQTHYLGKLALRIT
jgi:NADPH2:quinone reductase